MKIHLLLRISLCRSKINQNLILIVVLFLILIFSLNKFFILCLRICSKAWTNNFYLLQHFLLLFNQIIIRRFIVSITKYICVFIWYSDCLLLAVWEQLKLYYLVVAWFVCYSLVLLRFWEFTALFVQVCEFLTFFVFFLHHLIW